MTEERYEIRGKIGQGGIGAVYKAYDTQLNREVAIKRVIANENDPQNDTATQNLLKEAASLSSVQHPNICSVYDVGIDEDGPFVVMELINGKTLDQMVKKGTLTYEDFREVAIQSQEAMIAAQELNIIHRDLKPSNVMVSWLPSGRFQIKLVDFGLAKFSAKPSVQTIDHRDSVFGSIFFMAPEQFERTPLDQRTDMYSLGAMFYYALSGHFPFDGESAPQVMASHLQGSVVPLQQIRPDLPVWLSEWVMWHIQKNMEHRPNSAQDALDKFLADESTAIQGTLGGPPQLIPPHVTTSPVLIIPGASPQPTRAPAHPQGTITSPISNIAPSQLLPSSVQQATRTSPPPLPPHQAPSPPVLRTPATPPVSPTVTQTATSCSTPPKVPLHSTNHQAQQLTPTEEVQLLSSQKKPMSKMQKIIIFSILIVGILISCIILITSGNENSNSEIYNRLTKGIQGKGELFVTKDELNILLDSVIGTTNVAERIGAYIAFTKVKSADESFSPPLQMTKFAISDASQLSPKARKKMFEAISFNKPYRVKPFEMMLKYAKTHPDSPAAEQAVGQLKKIISDTFFDDVLNIHNTTKELNTKTKCVNIMLEIIRKSTNKKTLSKKLISQYKAASSDADKLSYIRVIGATGTNDALKILQTTLKSDNPVHVHSATRGLSKWPNLKPFPDMLSAYAKSPSASSKKIRKDIFSFLKTNDHATTSQKIKMWKELIQAAPDNRETHQILGLIANQKTNVSTNILKYVITLPSIDKKSKEYAQNSLKKRNK